MNYKKDVMYIILVNVGKILTYEAIIIDEDDDFLRFIDKNNKEWNYNKNAIISVVQKDGKK